MLDKETEEKLSFGIKIVVIFDLMYALKCTSFLEEPLRQVTFDTLGSNVYKSFL